MYPVGKAQQIVLDAMGVKKFWFSDAEEYFAEIGIIVRSKRVGRTSQPEITVLSRTASAMDEDGTTWQQYNDIDLSPIQQWIVG